MNKRVRIYSESELELYTSEQPFKRKGIILGEKFNYLTTISYGKVGNMTGYFCRCDCGNLILVKSASLRNSHTKSCGCGLGRDVKDYNKFLSVNEEVINNKGILFISQEQWKNNTISYWCPDHGGMVITKGSLTNKRGRDLCRQCGLNKGGKKRVLTTEIFIERSKRIHGSDKYDYSKSVYTASKEPITLECKLHKKEFTHTPDRHFAGTEGCPVCNNNGGGFSCEKSGNFYVTKWESTDGTVFIKYGITNGSPESRAKKQKHREAGVRFDFEVLLTKHFEYGRDCLNFETEVSRSVGSNFISKDDFPDGHRETTSLDKLPIILEMLGRV